MVHLPKSKTDTICKMHLEGYRVWRICLDTQVSPKTVREVLASAGHIKARPKRKSAVVAAPKILQRDNIESNSDVGAYLPSPEEIARKAAEIRKSWSDATEATRLGRRQLIPTYEIPVIGGEHRRRGAEIK